MLREHGLRLPHTNERVDGHVVDRRWPDHKLTVELDSYRFHNTRHAWEQDRRREREARARGDDFRRFTYDDITKNETIALNELRQVLSSPR